MASREMQKAFAPAEVEDRLYRFWEESGYFTPRRVAGVQPFTIIMPPPNVTGALHLGHALTSTLEDIMIRYQRMRGVPALYLPGEDHSGIAAQVVVERLLAGEGKDRHELGREAFLERMWQWTRQSRRTIADQHRRLGASADWTREVFTLDEGPSRAVRTTFVNLYHKGLLYRGERIVNWCPRCSTVLSDLEVDHQEVAGHLWYVRYHIDDGGQERYITVATTRPETILGDTAVAVHPEDERLSDLIGCQAVVPVLERRIPIVGDEAVEREFGTGAVKVTPAHDPTDYEIGQRHQLPAINIMNLDATLNDNAGPFSGKDRYVARRELLRELERQGLLVKTEAYSHSVGHCGRCKTVVEPIISRQWFVNVKPLAEPAIEAVTSGRIRIVPERFEKTYINWMENIRDWCVSRQLWWGHRIPVWYCNDCDAVVAPSAEAPLTDPVSCPACGSSSLRQDADVLDTWFSSALWPHSTLGWPNETEDLRYFYPTSVMETGYDILFFWVARMIMMGIENMGDIPFHTVYLHGLIRDEKGEKMSKMKGNVIDPLQVVAEYGADALRFTLATGTAPGNDMRLSPDKLEYGRNFANKIWNAARFIQGELNKSGAGLQPVAAEALAMEDRWIMSRLGRVISEVDRFFADYQFGEAGRVIYEFVWGEFCDWYIELAKIRLRNPIAGQTSPLPVLVTVLDQSLKLVHPYMPYVTEEIWQHLLIDNGAAVALGLEPAAEGPTMAAPGTPVSLMVQPWPTAGTPDEEAEAKLELLLQLVRGVRNARSEFAVEAGRYVEAIVQAGDNYDFLAANQRILETLARLRPLNIERQLPNRPASAISVIAAGVEVYLPLAGLVNLELERQRVNRELETLTRQLDSLRARLANESFTAKAPAAVVEKERARLSELEQRRSQLEQRRQMLTS